MSKVYRAEVYKFGKGFLEVKSLSFQIVITRLKKRSVAFPILLSLFHIPLPLKSYAA